MAGVTYPVYTTNTFPNWAGDFLGPNHLIPAGGRVDPAQFLVTGNVLVTVGAAGAAAAATSVPVAALLGPIPSGAVLDFGGTKFARLTAAAVAGATTLTVAPLPTALVNNDAATYVGTGTKKWIPSGTPVGRTIAERDAGTPYGPAGAADDEVYLVAFDIDDAGHNADVDLVKPMSGMVVKENFLPSGIAAGVMTKLRAAYTMTRGIN